MPRVQLVQWDLPVQWDRSGRRDQRETRVLPVRPEPPVLLVQQDLPVQLDRLGRKAPPDPWARPEGLVAGRNFRAAACLWCRPESPS